MIIFNTYLDIKETLKMIGWTIIGLLAILAFWLIVAILLHPGKLS